MDNQNDEVADANDWGDEELASRNDELASRNATEPIIEPYQPFEAEIRGKEKQMATIKRWLNPNSDIAKNMQKSGLSMTKLKLYHQKVIIIVTCFQKYGFVIIIKNLVLIYLV